ncbi:hypothetical protein AAH178_004505 [Serratia marcescens]
MNINHQECQDKLSSDALCCIAFMIAMLFKHACISPDVINKDILLSLSRISGLGAGDDLLREMPKFEINTSLIFEVKEMALSIYHIIKDV